MADNDDDNNLNENMKTDVKLIKTDVNENETDTKKNMKLNRVEDDTVDDFKPMSNRTGFKQIIWTNQSTINRIMCATSTICCAFIVLILIYSFWIND